MKAVLFESRESHNFYPLSLTRPLWELRVGCFTFAERLELFLKRYHGGERPEIHYFTRDYLAPLFRHEYPERRINEPDRLEKAGEILFVDATTVPPPGLGDLRPDTVYTINGKPALALINEPLAREQLFGRGGDVSDFLDSLTAREDGAALGLKRAEYIWNLVEMNPDLIKSDFSLIRQDNPQPRPEGVTFLGDPNQLYIEGDVLIDPFVCLDATGGPVIIRRGVRVNPFTRIEGPAFIDENCLLLGARIREGTSLGKYCRVGGEVEESIFHDYSNKYHDGFIGHACVGSWVNMGAMTTNSDLKNNYSPVKVYIPSRRVSTGSLKVGCFMGDYTRTSIGTLINTGSSIGVGCMLVHAGHLSPAHLPSFTWFMGNALREGEGNDSLYETAAAMMARRGKRFGATHKGMLEEISRITETNRREELDKWKKAQK